MSEHGPNLLGPADARAMAAWAIANLQAQIEETGVTVTIQTLPPVRAYDRLSRVFQNLIENAIKYPREDAS